jgi:hypothetical protein
MSANRYRALTIDVTTTALTKAIGGTDAMRSLRHVQASDSLAGEQILEVVRRSGWAMAARRSYITDMAFANRRIERMMAGRPRPEPPLSPGTIQRASGVNNYFPAR